jgi:hypothetical protein
VAEGLDGFLEAVKQTAVSFLPESLGDLTPLPAIQAGHAALSGQLQGRERIAAGIGAALGVAGLGASVYHRWQAGELRFTEEGMLALPSVERIQGHPFRWSKVPAEYRPIDLRSQIILNAKDFDDLARLVGRHGDLMSQARTGGFLQAIGRDLAGGEAHAPHLAGYQLPENAHLAAAKWELAKVDALHRQGLLDGPGATELKAAYEDLLERPERLFDPETGVPTERAQTLRDFIGVLSRVTQDVEDATLRLPPDRAWRAVEMGPQGPRFAVVHREQRLPVRFSKEEVHRRLDHFDYEAAIPEMVTNLLRSKGLLTTPGEVAKGMRWYAEANDLAQELVRTAASRGKELTVQQAAAIISAFSPQAKWWPDNVLAAKHFVDSGGTATSGPFQVIPQAWVTARRLWDGEAVDRVLRFEKTSNFARNIADPKAADPVTIDRHSLEAAMGFRTFEGDWIGFDDSHVGRRAYRAVAEAHRIAARIEGLTANQIQAITWLPVQSFKGPGVRSGFEYGSALRESLLGQGADSVVTVAARAEGDDLGPVAHLRPERRRGDPTRPAFVEVLEPGGTSTVIGEGASTLLSEAFRTLRPLYRPPDGDLGWVRFVPVEAQAVADTDAAVRASIEQLVDRRHPAGGSLERHPTPDHPGMVPGNKLVIQAPLDEAHRLTGLRNELAVREVPAEVSDLVPHDRYLPELKAQRIGPDDVAGWSRRQVSREMLARQWVGISGWRSGASAEENAAANAALRSTLERRGYRPIEVDGYYDGHEKSFIVFGMPNSEAMELGRRFKQESVVSPLGLLYTTGPNRGKYNPSLGRVNTPGPNVDNYYSEMTVKGGTRRFQLELDFDRLESIPADPDAAVRPAARPHAGITVDLGEQVNPALIDEVWDLAQQHGLYATAYVHGDVGPRGAARVSEHHLTDSAGRQVVYRSLARNLDDPNATWAYVPAEDAASFSAEPLPAIHGGAERHSAVEMGGRFGDAVYDGGLRLVYGHLGPDVVISTRNPLLAKAGGKQQSQFALWVPAGDLPALAYGPDAARFGADPTRVVVGRFRKGRVALRAPGSLADPSRINEVAIHRARQVLERAGVAPGSIALEAEPWATAAAGSPPR